MNKRDTYELRLADAREGVVKALEEIAEQRTINSRLYYANIARAALKELEQAKGETRP